MSDLMICNRLFLLIRKHGILLLITGNYNLDTFFQICLGYKCPVRTDSTKRALVDDIRKLGSRCTGCHTCNRMEIYIIANLDFSCMYLEDCLTAFQVRQFHRYTPVKTSRSGQCWIKGFRTVRCRQNDNTIISFKSIHLS